MSEIRDQVVRRQGIRGILLLGLILWLGTGCVFDFSDDDDEADGSGNPDSVRVDTGLIESRSLGELSDSELDLACEALENGTAGLLSQVESDAFCLYTALVSAHPVIADSGLETARAACKGFVSNCVDNPPRVDNVMCNRDALDVWAGCGITVGEVEDCHTTDNAAQLEEIADLGELTCDDLTEELTLGRSESVTSACRPIDVCNATAP